MAGKQMNVFSYSLDVVYNVSKRYITNYYLFTNGKPKSSLFYVTIFENGVHC